MQILIKPILTEKSISQTGLGRYVYKVAKKANKHQIAKAIQDLYKVTVLNVNIVNVKGEEKLVRGRFKKKIPGFKKAIITLKKGQKIPGYEEK
jgi:large subunit ribosomal protein L23